MVQHVTVSLRTLPSEASRSQRNGSHGPRRHDHIFAGYNELGPYAKAFDEMFDGQGNVRGPYKGIYAELAPSDTEELEAARRPSAAPSSTRASRSRCPARSARSP